MRTGAEFTLGNFSVWSLVSTTEALLQQRSRPTSLRSTPAPPSPTAHLHSLLSRFVRCIPTYTRLQKFLGHLGLHSVSINFKMPVAQGPYEPTVSCSVALPHAPLAPARAKVPPEYKHNKEHPCCDDKEHSARVAKSASDEAVLTYATGRTPVSAISPFSITNNRDEKKQ